MQYESRQYEIHIDPDDEAVVHLAGFERPAAVPQELADATPADQVRWIFDNPGDDSRSAGERVVEILLAGRNASELPDEELSLLAKGYNWCGRHGLAFEIAKLALRRTSHSAA